MSQKNGNYFIMCQNDPYGYVKALCRVELKLQTEFLSLRASAPFQKRRIRSLSSGMMKSKILELKLYFYFYMQCLSS